MKPKEWLLKQPEEMTICLEVLDRMNKNFISKDEVLKLIDELQKKIDNYPSTELFDENDLCKYIEELKAGVEGKQSPYENKKPK